MKNNLILNSRLAISSIIRANTEFVGYAKTHLENLPLNLKSMLPERNPLYGITVNWRVIGRIQ